MTRKLSPAMQEALRDAAHCLLYAPREDGRFHSYATIAALINRDLLAPGFPHSVTKLGYLVLEQLEKADDSND